MWPHEGSVLPVGYLSLRKELDEKLTAKNCGTYSGNPMLNKRNREKKAGHIFVCEDDEMISGKSRYFIYDYYYVPKHTYYYCTIYNTIIYP